MKKSKSVIVILLILIVIIVSTIVIIVLPKKEDNITDQTESKYTMSELEEVDEIIPDFKIDIVGAYEGTINPSILKEREKKAYKFSTNIVESDSNVSSSYVGFKLSDVLDALDIYEYSSLEFRNVDSYASKVREVDDKLFLVFKKNDKNIDVTLLRVDRNYDKSIENITDLYIFNDYENTLDDNR